MATLGCGPCREDEFDAFLLDLEVEVYHPGPETELVVIGRHGWNVGQLEDLVS